MRFLSSFLTLATCAFVGLITPLAHAQSFAPKVDYPASGTQTFGVAVGDFNSDAKSDLAVVNNGGSGPLNVFLNNGDGTFAAKVDYPTGAFPRSVAVGDFNSDGKSDLAVANYTSSTVSVLFNNGNGTFAAKVDYPTASSPYNVAVGDFNGDGKSDLVTANLNSNSASVLLNNGNGTFATKVDYTTGTSPRSVAVGDFNADGKSDFAIANSGNGVNTVSVFLNNGNGTFAAKTDYTTGTSPYSVAVGDFNADGKSDLVIGNNGVSTASVFLNNGNGTFAAKVDYTTASSVQSVAVGDFNLDGKSDFVTSNLNSTVSVLLNNGNGTFAAKADFTTGTLPYGVAVGDFNADSKSDIATANFSSNNTSVLLNTAAAPTATTGSASSITTTSATLNATVNPNGAATTAQFQYGTTTAYGSTASVTLSPNSGASAQSVSATLTGLTPLTLYHFRISATNSLGTTNGADATFTTSETPSLIVTTTSDTSTNTDGLTSLREAITYANTLSGADTITFAIPGTGVKTITVSSSLPAITGTNGAGTVIDGYTQSGASVNTLTSGTNAVLTVQITASAKTFDVLTISTSGCTVRGLAMGGTSAALVLSGSGATGNKVIGNFLGTTPDGTTALANNVGIYLGSGASNNTIGGTTLAERNLISGNTNGVLIDGSTSTGNKVAGNTIGTNAAATAALPNTNNGITIQNSASNNTVGGTTSAERNLISGNSGSGVTISGGSSNKVSGNYIGVSADGSAKLANGIGVNIASGSNNTTGGTTVGERNVISGNTNYNVYLFLGTGNKVMGNYIGTTADGSAALTTIYGVYAYNSSNNTIGGTTAGERNIISGSSQVGVYLNGTPSTGNKVIGNYIGTNADGSAKLPNNDGVFIGAAPNNTIGGTTAGERNIISGNTSSNVVISGTDSTGNKVSGNYLGLNAAGTATFASNQGVYLFNSASNNTIGGTTAGERNIISGSSYAGVQISGPATTGNKLTGNFIGTSADGTTALANSTGIIISSAPGNTIGGISAGASNLIFGNTGDGVLLQNSGTTGNSIRGNSIYNNGTTVNDLGIDLLGANGVNANDVGDADTGPNNLQNYPVLSSAFANSGNTTIAGTLNSTANTTFTLDFYSNATGDVSGYGEGQTYLGSTSVTTDASGNVSFTATLSGVQLANGLAISATATDANGNTSEFSRDVTSGASPAGSVVISEFRFSGPSGPRDEYIELFNPTGNPVDLSTYTLSASNVTTALSGLSLSGKTIPAFGRLLLTNSDGYSLGGTYPSTYPTGSTTPSSYATGDVQYTGDIALGSTLTLLNGGTFVDNVGDLSGTAGFASGNQYAFVRRFDSSGNIDTDTDTNDFNLVDTASTKGPPTLDGLSSLVSGARLGTPGPQNTLAPNQRATITLVPLDPASNQGIVPDGRYATRGSNLDPFGRLTLRRTITNYGSTTLKQIRFILVRTTAGTGVSSGSGQASGVADLRAITSVGVSANGTKVVQAIQIEAPTTPTTPSNQLSSSDTGNGGGLNASWNVGTLPAGGLAPGQSMNVEFVFGIVRLGNYNVSIVIQNAS